MIMLKRMLKIYGVIVPVVLADDYTAASDYNLRKQIKHDGVEMDIEDVLVPAIVPSAPPIDLDDDNFPHEMEFRGTAKPSSWSDAVSGESRHADDDPAQQEGTHDPILIPEVDDDINMIQFQPPSIPRSPFLDEDPALGNTDAEGQGFQPPKTPSLPIFPENTQSEASNGKVEELDLPLIVPISPIFDEDTKNGIETEGFELPVSAPTSPILDANNLAEAERFPPLAEIPALNLPGSASDGGNDDEVEGFQLPAVGPVSPVDDSTA